MLGSCFGVHFFVRILEGGFSHVGKSSVFALVFGFGMDLCQTSVILNHCIKCEWYRALLTYFIGMLVSRIGGGSGVGFRPFVVHPPSCQGGRYHNPTAQSREIPKAHYLIQNGNTMRQCTGYL